MQNKIRIDGSIENQLNVSKFGTTFIRLQGKREVEFQGNKTLKPIYIGVSIPKYLTEEVCKRFKKGDIIRIEGYLDSKPHKDITDANGYQIYEVFINARKIDALAGANISTQATIQQNQQYQQAAPQKTMPAKQPTPIFKKQVNAPYGNQSQSYEPAPNPNDSFGDDLPF